MKYFKPIVARLGLTVACTGLLMYAYWHYEYITQVCFILSITSILIGVWLYFELKNVFVSRIK